MSKFKNNKSNKNQGIHTIFGQHSVKAALQNDKREHIELIISKNQINFAKKYESKIQKITILSQNQFTKRFGNENTIQGVVLKTRDFSRPNLEEFVKVADKKLEERQVEILRKRVSEGFRRLEDEREGNNGK